MDAAHRDTTKREFAKQAVNFERPGSIFRDRDILDWIGEHVPVSPGDVVLDVAGGSGRLGRYLAETAAFAVVVDLTPEVLAAGTASAAEDETRNVVFAEGDASNLPFADAQFDLVASRFAFHHFDDPPQAAAEMARVCRPGGVIAVIDLVSEAGDVGLRHNEIERLRDPSHTRALARAELLETLASAGVDAEIASERDQRLDARRWLDQAVPGQEAYERLLNAFEDEAGGGSPTGLRATRADPGLTIEQTWVIAAGRRS